MSDFVLYPQDVEKLGALLREYIANARVRCAFLTNKEGLLLSCEGATDAIDTVSVAALVTGSFNATVTIANLIGEAEFTTMFHRGKKKHIHIALVDQERYLASVFDNATTVQKVGYYASRCGKALREYLQSMSGNAETAFLPDEEESSGDIDFDHVFEPLREAEIGAVEQLAAKESIGPPAPAEETRQEELIAAVAAASAGPESGTPEEPAVASVPAPSAVIPRSAFLRRKIREARAYQRLSGMIHWPAI